MPKQWVALYEGKIAAPETGRYRFWGVADDVLLARVKNRLVIDASRPSMGQVAGWKSDDDQNRKFEMSGDKLVVGDWFASQTPSRLSVCALKPVRPLT